MVEQRQKTRPVRCELTSEDCAHYWMIESPAGETSQGRCKFCGAIRTFFNSTQRSSMLRSSKSPAVRNAS